jgi:hypothetical protein
MTVCVCVRERERESRRKCPIKQNLRKLNQQLNLNLNPKLNPKLIAGMSDCARTGAQVLARLSLDGLTLRHALLGQSALVTKLT